MEVALPVISFGITSEQDYSSVLSDECFFETRIETTLQSESQANIEETQRLDDNTQRQIDERNLKFLVGERATKFQALIVSKPLHFLNPGRKTKWLRMFETPDEYKIRKMNQYRSLVKELAKHLDIFRQQAPIVGRPSVVDTRQQFKATFKRVSSALDVLLSVFGGVYMSYEIISHLYASLLTIVLVRERDVAYKLQVISFFHRVCSGLQCDISGVETVDRNFREKLFLDCGHSRALTVISEALLSIRETDLTNSDIAEAVQNTIRYVRNVEQSSTADTMRVIPPCTSIVTTEWAESLLYNCKVITRLRIERILNSMPFTCKWMMFSDDELMIHNMYKRISGKMQDAGTPFSFDGPRVELVGLYMKLLDQSRKGLAYLSQGPCTVCQSNNLDMSTLFERPCKTSVLQVYDQVRLDLKKEELAFLSTQTDNDGNTRSSIDFDLRFDLIQSPYVSNYSNVEHMERVFPNGESDQLSHSARLGLQNCGYTSMIEAVALHYLNEFRLSLKVAALDTNKINNNPRTNIDGRVDLSHFQQDILGPQCFGDTFRWVPVIKKMVHMLVWLTKSKIVTKVLHELREQPSLENEKEQRNEFIDLLKEVLHDIFDEIGEKLIMRLTQEIRKCFEEPSTDERILRLANQSQN